MGGTGHCYIMLCICITMICHLMDLIQEEGRVKEFVLVQVDLALPVTWVIIFFLLRPLLLCMDKG